MKRRITATVLASTLGFLGAHRFYLGQRFRGILYIILSVFSFIITVEEGVPLILAPILLSIMDGVLLGVMPKEEFDYKFNRQPWQVQSQPAYPSRSKWKEPSLTRDRKPDNPYKRRGIQKFRNYDYRGAAEDFIIALEEEPGSASIHFNLACCYSLLEDPEESLYQLDQALQNGFADLDKIHDHSALAYLRTTPLFDEFVKSGYQMPTPVNTPATASTSPTPEGLIEQIKRLGELKDQGILTEAEFQEQKAKVMRTDR